MDSVDIVTDKEAGRMTVHGGGRSGHVPVGHERVGLAARCGHDVALAMLADVADGAGLEILQAAAARRDRVSLDGLSVDPAVLRWALSRPRTAGLARR